MDGKADAVFKIDFPFDAKKVEAMNLSFIFSEPEIFKKDQAMQQFALDKLNAEQGPKVLSFFFLLESLFRVRTPPFA